METLSKESRERTKHNEKNPHRACPHLEINLVIILCVCEGPARFGSAQRIAHLHLNARKRVVCCVCPTQKTRVHTTSEIIDKDAEHPACVLQMDTVGGKGVA